MVQIVKMLLFFKIRIYGFQLKKTNKVPNGKKAALTYDLCSNDYVNCMLVQ